MASPRRRSTTRPVWAGPPRSPSWRTAITPNGTACPRTRTSPTACASGRTSCGRWAPSRSRAPSSAWSDTTSPSGRRSRRKVRRRRREMDPDDTDAGRRAERDGRRGDGARPQDRGHRGGGRDRPRTALGARGALVRGPDILHLLVHRVAHLDALPRFPGRPVRRVARLPRAPPLGGSRVRGCLDAHVRAMGFTNAAHARRSRIHHAARHAEVLPVPQRGRRRRQVQRRSEDAVLGGGAGRPGPPPVRHRDVATSGDLRPVAPPGELHPARHRLQPLLRDDHRAHLPGDGSRAGHLPLHRPRHRNEKLGPSAPPALVPRSHRRAAQELRPMWIVRLALRRPYTFVVLAMLIVLMGVMTVLRMPTDMYPEINIPVVAAVWNYNGLPPTEMEGRIASIFERATTTTVSGIEHLESLTLAGTSVIKIFMQPGSSVDGAVAQVAAVSQPILRQMPPGAIAPLVLGYSATNVPVLQLGLTSPTLPEQQVYDLTTNFLRTGLATVQGAQVPLPYGGKVRTIVVDIDPQKLFAWGISPSEG